MQTMTPQEKEAYVARIRGWRSTLSAIRLSSNITSAQGKTILSQLDDLYGSVRLEYGDVMKQYKEAEQLIERIRYKGQVGSNTEARKANGVIAVENVAYGETTINLYEIHTEITNQREDLEALLDIIEKKQSMVITMSGLLKIESNISGH